MNFEVVIGLETHIEQNTQTKMFCACKNEFNAAPNSCCCDVCTGLPGALPVINEEAVNKIIKLGLALNCKINNVSVFDRKGYFYPDNPKSYQITQFHHPICTNGFVEIEDNGKTKQIRIHEIHLEEDAGKLIHNSLTGETMVDFNRCGVPLMEIVTEPDFRSTAEVMAYLEKIKAIAKAVDASDCKMERGELRCDVNISLRPFGSEKFGERTEMKNINSFKAIERAINYEVARQTKILESGGKIHQQTLRWDDAAGQNYSMRSKENANDYRYFPEPDLNPLFVSNETIEKIKSQMQLLPHQRKAVYEEKYGFSSYDAEQLSKEEYIYSFFDAAVDAGIKPKTASSWIQGEIAKIINEEMAEKPSIKVGAKDLAQIIKMQEEGTISQATAREVLRKVWGTNQNPEELVKKLGLAAVSDDESIRKVLEDIFEKNPQAVADYKSGNKKTVAFFVGQTMKATQGKANAAVVNKLLAEMLQ